MSGTRDRPAPSEYHEYFAGYVARVPDGDIVAILRDQIGETRTLLDRFTEAQAGRSYAPGKWSVKEVIGHMADVERVFAYRALRFARADATPLASFEENDYVPAGRFDDRRLGDLAAELTAVRAATVALFGGLPALAWARGGQASGRPWTVRALAWITAGHELHHRHILETRYLRAS